MAKQTLKQRKAIRSAAAKKGWDTRIARERREIEAADARNTREFERQREQMERMQNAYRLPDRREVIAQIEVLTPDILRNTPRKPSLWQRIKGWVLRAA